MRDIFKSKKPEPVSPAEPVVQTEGRWGSHVCFGADGWFHPVITDDNGVETGVDLTRRLVWCDSPDGGHYEFATVADVNHFATHGLREQMLEPTSEVHI